MKRTKKSGKLLVFSQEMPTYEKREETLEGIKYTVVPVVMMVEGVHSGSRGPLLHTAEELGKLPDAWNGRPVVIGHPQIDGQYVSANNPTILEENKVGFIFNTKMEDNKLKAEAWIQMDKLQTVSPQAYANIENGDVMEVSVGVFTDEEPVQGVWHDEQYTAIAHNHRPDHLALLPQGVGACSVVDGCGIRVNEAGDVQVNSGKTTYADLKRLNKAGYVLRGILVQKDFIRFLEDVRNKIYNMDSNTESFYLEEVNDNYVIYSKRANGVTSYYKQAYQTVSNDSVEWIGAPIQVTRNVTYEPVSNPQATVNSSINNKNKEVTMNSKNGCTACKEKIDALITNEATPYKEEDREWLNNLEEAQLDKMAPVIIEKKIEVNKEVPAQITKEQAFKALGIENPAEYEAQMKFGLGMYRAQVDKMVKTILANTGDVWKEEELKAMPFETLQKLAQSIPTKKAVEEPVDYSMFGAKVPEIEVNTEIEPMPLPGVEFETSK